ncbi:MAG TPA: hypothetical protein VEM76_00975 [Anaeromyxobacteraceae bacterium]|nr:hypothetical protein [Anaeromyxobacteraceae bacterium]
MAGLLFVSQSMLYAWAEQRKIGVDGDLMLLLTGPGKGRSYALEPATRFLKLVGAEQDPHRLVGKVKTEGQLRKLGAEVLGASVLLGDVGYEVQPGFLAEAKGTAAASEAPGQGAGTDEAEVEKQRAEAEALARFLLENLS